LRLCTAGSIAPEHPNSSDCRKIAVRLPGYRRP
jgi:hypothetical protein